MQFYFDEEGVVLFVCGFPSVPSCRIFPIQVQPIEMMLTEEANAIFDKGLSTLRIGHELGESSRALIPSANGNQCLESLVVRLESIELGVAICEWGSIIELIGFELIIWVECGYFCQCLGTCRMVWCPSRTWVLRRRRWDVCRGRGWCCPEGIWLGPDGRRTYDTNHDNYHMHSD